MKTVVCKDPGPYLACLLFYYSLWSRPPTARLVNMQGHVVRRFTITNVKELLPLTGLPAGTYFLITAGKQTFKIVKQ